jgi:DNA topoisomerase VI subunit B
MFVRQDWELFRNINDLSHKAGVPKDKVAALVAKELVDNALDACQSCDIGELGDDGFYVQDNGPGIDTGQVADLFSISRPLRSTKLLRLPSRGALGNGLRVVAGAVLANRRKAHCINTRPNLEFESSLRWFYCCREVR